METSELRSRLRNAFEELLPLFRVTCEELQSFRKPKIRRFLNSEEYPEHPRFAPAYSCQENFLYFPSGDNIMKPTPIFRSAFELDLIYHEVGHYIHSFINPDNRKRIDIRLRTGEFPSGHNALNELVAEYGNFILGIAREDWYPAERKVYFERGSAFLPQLARMSLDEAISEGIVHVASS